LLRVERSSEHSAGPGRAGLFVVPLAAALSPLDYVLAGMVAAGLGIEALCLYLGLARTALFERIVALGLLTPHDRQLRRPGGKRPWLAGEVHELIRLWVSGVRVVCIADCLGRSPGAVWSKARRLGLPKRDRRKLVRLEPISRPAADPEPATLVRDFVAPAAHEAAVSESTSSTIDAVPAAPSASLAPAPVSENNEATGQLALASGSADPAEGRQVIAKQDAVSAAAAPAGGGQRRKQSRPGQVTWFREADEEVSLRWWANQHPIDIAREMSETYMELTASAVSSRCHRLQLPPRYGNTLVAHFDPKVAESTIKASGFVSRFCPGKKRIFWTKPRWGQRFCPEYRRSKTFQDRAGGIDQCYA